MSQPVSVQIKPRVTPVVAGLRAEALGEATALSPGFLVENTTPGQVEVIADSNWGIDSQGEPYFNPEGAAPGEMAALTIDPNTGNPSLILLVP